MDTIVISAFPTCGKTYAYDHQEEWELTIADSDSSEFSWIKDSDGNNTKERNPEFPQNYINHINSLLGKVDIIFVSSHEDVRKAMTEAGINFITIYPYPAELNSWVGRMYLRGNNENFIKFIHSNWTDFMNEATYGKYMGADTLWLKGNEYINKKMLDTEIFCLGFAQ